MNRALAFISIAIGGVALYFYIAPRAGLQALTSGTGSTTELKALANSIAGQYGIPANIFRALIQTESAWNTKAVSPVGAQGLTQLMPGTAKDMGVSNAFDPIQALQGGAKYLAAQYAKFKSWPLALAAYNAGPGNVTKYKGIPPFAETRAYVTKIMSLSLIS